MEDLEEGTGICSSYLLELLSSLVLKPLAVRLFRSTKSLGFNSIRCVSDRLGRGFLALGSSPPPSRGGVDVLTVAALAILNSLPLEDRSRFRGSPVALVLAMPWTFSTAEEIFGPMSTSLTLHVFLSDRSLLTDDAVDAIISTESDFLFSPIPSRFLLKPVRRLKLIFVLNFELDFWSLHFI